MTPTMNNDLEINGSVSLISDICGCGENHSRSLKKLSYVFFFDIDAMLRRISSDGISSGWKKRI